MLSYVTKNRYWDILDKGIMTGVPATAKWHLKDIQDAVAYSYLYNKEALDIAEIGAGHSRLLATLVGRNRCYAIDEYKGAGGGPKSRPVLEKVEFINCIVGNSGDLIKDESFDIIFSVSVVEHVPSNQLPYFFKDCWRILKSGGLMIHLIDTYTEGADGDNGTLWSRCKAYRQPFDDGFFAPVGSIEFSSLADMAFKTSFATNSDQMMRDWNKSSPSLIEKRKVAQSCSVEMAGRRIL